MPKETTLKSVDRALNVLQILASNEVPPTLSEIAKRAELPFSTTHRLLATLMAKKYVRYDPEAKTYGLGMMVLSLADAVKSQISIYQEAKPILEELATRVNETSNLVILNDQTAVYSLMANSSRTITTKPTLGGIVPLHATAGGKALMAYFDAPALERCLDTPLQVFTKNTIVNPIQLREELQQIKTNGYSVDNEENEIGVRCLAAPVFNHRGEIIASIGISGPSSRLTREMDPSLVQPVMEAARKLSIQLGYNSLM